MGEQVVRLQGNTCSRYIYATNILVYKLARALFRCEVFSLSVLGAGHKHSPSAEYELGSR